MEAEVRAILRKSVTDDTAPPECLGSWIHQLFAGLGGAELVLPPRDELPRAPDFGE
jgi:plasmid stability protein